MKIKGIIKENEDYRRREEIIMEKECYRRKGEKRPITGLNYLHLLGNELQLFFTKFKKQFKEC